MAQFFSPSKVNLHAEGDTVQLPDLEVSGSKASQKQAWAGVT